MNQKRRQSVVWSNVGKLLIIVAFSMALPVLTALVYRERCLVDFLAVMGITMAAGLFCWLGFRPDNDKLHMQVREGAAIVTFGWILATAFGMIPYLTTGTVATVADAFFESMSGFATVGASILDDIEAAPKAVLMWRSTTHWLGGMGIVVLFVALLSNLGNNALQIFNAEASGPVKEKLSPKLSDSARILWGLYIGNTLVTLVLLVACGMPLFDAINHAFSIVATGGFSTKNESIGGYHSGLIEWVITGMMFMAGINYALLFQTIRGHSLQHFRKSLEFKTYAGIVVIATGVVTLVNMAKYPGMLLDNLRYSAFHVLSILTTTGFVSCDYQQWMPGATMAIILLMFSGACAGSTTCGIKIDRHLILFRQARREIQRFLHPRMVRNLKANEKSLPEQTMHNVTTFFYLFMTLMLGSVLILCCMGMEFLDAFTTALSCLGGVGPAVGSFGPTESFSAAPAAAKWLYSALMLIGRLEIYTVLAVFWPEKYRHLRYKEQVHFSEEEKIADGVGSN